MKTSSPNPGKGYRLIRFGEAIPKGKTRFDTDHPNEGWTETGVAGTKYAKKYKDVGLFYRTREGVKPVKESKQVNYERLALRMSKSKTIREAREIYKKAVGK